MRAAPADGGRDGRHGNEGASGAIAAAGCALDTCPPVIEGWLSDGGRPGDQWTSRGGEKDGATRLAPPELGRLPPPPLARGRRSEEEAEEAVPPAEVGRRRKAEGRTSDGGGAAR